MAREPRDRARRRLRLGLGVFFVALALPSGALVYRAYDQLKWESFRGQQLAAEDLAERIDRRLSEIARAEDGRPAADYGFLVSGPGLAGGHRSPLAAFPLRAEIPGLVGWFQVDEDGRFTSPLVPEGVDAPADFGVGPGELAGRQALAARIEGVLIGNRLVERGPPAQERDAGQVAAPRPARPVEPERASRESRSEYPETLAAAPVAVAQAPAPPSAQAPAPPSAQAPAPARTRAEPPRERLSQSAFDLLSAPRAAAPSKLATGREGRAGQEEQRQAADRKALADAQAQQESALAAERAAPAVQGLGRVEELSLDAELAERAPAAAGGAPLGAKAEPAPVEDQATVPAQPQAGGSVTQPRADSPAPAPAAAPSALATANRAPTPPQPATFGKRPAKGQDKDLAQRKQAAAKPAPTRAKEAGPGAPPGATVDLFGNAVEPFVVGLLGSGHFVLFRAVHKNGERLVQGLLIEQGPFLAALMEEPFRAAPLAATTDLIVAFRDEVLAAFRASAARGYVASARELTGALLYRTRMREPFGGLELIFSVGQLPVPPGAAAIGWVAGLLGLVLVGGTALMYRLGLRQLALVRQQQAFVSAVSHELKTPLTSIRMYAEMLRAGYADEDRRQVYYRYIQEESERLSRLIANVLALSRIGRDALTVAPQDLELAELMAQVRERLAAPVQRSGFRLDIDCSGAGEGTRVLADPDAILQVLINLVDNALKFAAQREPRLIEIRCERPREGWVRIGVRDYGPGVPRELRRRVFELFYRGAEAGARAIPGTGIGLALVERLTRAMGGQVELVGREPGVEARVELPSGGL